MNHAGPLSPRHRGWRWSRRVGNRRRVSGRRSQSPSRGVSRSSRRAAKRLRHRAFATGRKNFGYEPASLPTSVSSPVASGTDPPACEPFSPSRANRRGAAVLRSRSVSQSLSTRQDQLPSIDHASDGSGSGSALGTGSSSRPSTKLARARARYGCWSLRTAFDSICRTRSRVTEKILPTSSRVYA